MKRPAEKEYIDFYHKYISLVPEGNILEILEKQKIQFCEFMAKVPESKAEFRYAPDKWSIKEVITHLSDNELIFNYRAFRISRGDKQKLAGYEQDDYIKNVNLKGISLTELVEQFFNFRSASISMFKTVTGKMWGYTGNANNATLSVRACAYIMVGHVIHHMKILHSRYLNLNGH
jgi:hypothetical protein